MRIPNSNFQLAKNSALAPREQSRSVVDTPMGELQMRVKFLFLFFILASIAIFSALSWARPVHMSQTASTLGWTTSARLRRGLHGWVAGTLKMDSKGIEFQSAKTPLLRWSFVEIQTLAIYPRQVILTTYDKRGRFRPGSRQYRFALSAAVPPAVASELLQHLGRPSRNGDPDLSAPTIATISARHRTAFGGTRSNGVLRFGEAGIDYVTRTAIDSRSWRWSDIQTVSSPNAYELMVFGYRDTYSFDLKQPMTRALLDRLTDQIYRHQPLDAGAARYGEQ